MAPAASLPGSAPAAPAVVAAAGRRRLLLRQLAVAAAVVAAGTGLASCSTDPSLSPAAGLQSLVGLTSQKKCLFDFLRQN